MRLRSWANRCQIGVLLPAVVRGTFNRCRSHSIKAPSSRSERWSYPDTIRSDQTANRIGSCRSTTTFTCRAMLHWVVFDKKLSAATRRGRNFDIWLSRWTFVSFVLSLHLHSRSLLCVLRAVRRFSIAKSLRCDIKITGNRRLKAAVKYHQYQNRAMWNAPVDVLWSERENNCQYKINMILSS